MSERAEADAGAPSAPVPGAAGAPGNDEAAQETEGAAGAAGEHEADEPGTERDAPAAPETAVADPAGALPEQGALPDQGVLPEQAAVAEPLLARPEAREVSAPNEVSAINTEEGANNTPERRDFLRRLRSTAENIERLRSSEPTLVRMEGDVTVLTNVAPLERPAEPVLARPVLAVIPVAPAPLTEPPPSLGEHEGAALDSRTPEEPDGHWHWVWVLAGVATILLVPIGMLLTRATRNS
jgi:hypothetical protein